MCNPASTAGFKAWGGGVNSGAANMNLNQIELAKKQWLFIADAIPLLLCLIDRRGRIIRTNRTLERWGLGDVATIRGRSLHETLHPGCCAADCYLLAFENRILADIDHAGRAQVEAYDSLLDRYLAIDFQPVLAETADPVQEEVLAVLAVDDVSESKRAEIHVSQMQETLRQRIEQEMAKRIEVEEVQVRLLNILSKTPNFIAMAAPDGSLLYLNPSGRAMLELTDDDGADALNIFECLAPEARKAMIEEVLPLVQCDGVWCGSSELLGRRGRRVPTTQVVISHRRPDGAFDGFSVVEQDMTAWIQSEAALRSSQEELRQLSGQLIKVQEDERQRIAADLHDVIGQSLSLIKLAIDNAGLLVAKGAHEPAGEALKELSLRVKDALVEVRRISMDLSPLMIDDLGILPTLSWFFREFEAACQGVQVIRTIQVSEGEIPPPLKITLFRLLQEATTNIVKHAQASEVRVGLVRQDGFLELTVVDNGLGFETKSIFKGDRAGKGVGLRSMKERVRLSGGIYALESGVGQGTRIRVAWPAFVGDV